MSASFTYFVDVNGLRWGLNVNPDGTLQTTVVGGSGTIPSGGFYTTAAGDIINACIQDSQNMTTNRSALLDYVNRIQQRILRESQWQFLLSEKQRFITQPGQGHYWIGSGAAPAGTVDTGLQLPDVWSIPNDQVFDGSNWRQLMPDSQKVLNSPAYSFQDTAPRYDRPRSYHYEITRPNVLGIFPLPDNQNIYQPVPAAPYCTVSVGGSLPGRTYYVAATFVDTQGNEGQQSTQFATIYVPMGYLLNVAQPKPEVASAANVAYTSWNLYVGTGNNGSTNMMRQNASPLSANFVEPTSGLVPGPISPQHSNLEPLYGYVIEFRYFKQRPIIQTVDDILTIPDIYRDVVIAGVNYFTELYRNQVPQNQSRSGDISRASVWKTEFLDGVRQIRKDLNVNFKKTDFITPDSTSQYQYGNRLDYPSLGI